MSRLRLVALLGGALLVGACRNEPPPPDAVVRVGDAYLTEAALARVLQATPPGVDTLLARKQYIEQWVTNQLLAQEARRRGMREREGVLRQLEENETNVLAAALVSELYEGDGAAVSAAELEAYFEQNRERLRLREPYVRVRFVEAADAAAAEEARAALQALTRPGLERRNQDALFASAARRLAVDTSASLALARSLVPQSRLVRQSTATPWAVVARLREGEVSAALPTATGTFLVVQVAERIPAGALPELAWVQEDIYRQLLIQNRKRLVAREVQRLRAEAEARGALLLPPD